MKIRFDDKKLIFFAIMVLFIVGQLFGTIAIKTLFINYKIKELSPQLAYIAEEIGEGNYSVSRKNDFMLKAYDVYGKEIDIFKDESIESTNISENAVPNLLSRYMPFALAGQKVAVIEKIEGHPSKSIVIGMPIIHDQQVMGVLFLLKPASDFTAVLNGFYLVFSVTLAIGTCFISLFLHLYLKEMKQLEQTRRDYIANVSHELKSPVASIKALMETLSDKVVDDEDTRDKYYSIILKENSNLQKLITDMLELSRLQSGGAALKKEKIAVSDLLQEILDKYKALTTDLDLSLSITDRAMNAPVIYSNKDRLIQVFNILIDNAIKFAKEDGSIFIDAEIGRKQIRFKVCDNGIGIDPSIMPYIFERFYKGNIARNTGGSGLGLAIAKEILTGLGEKIEVSSESGKGTIFTFTVQRV